MIENGLDASEIEKFDYQAEGALYLPVNARFSYLLDLAEGQDVGKAVSEALAVRVFNNLRHLELRATLSQKGVSNESTSFIYCDFFNRETQYLHCRD